MIDVTNKTTVALERWIEREPNDGVDPRSRYVEHFWIPIAGPTAVCLARTLMRMIAREGRAVVVQVEHLEAMLGLHGPEATERLRDAFDVLFDVGILLEDPPDDRGDGPLGLLVRPQFPRLTDEQVARLPGDLDLAHRAPHSMQAAATLDAPLDRRRDLGPHLRVLSLASTIDEILVNATLDAGQLAYRWQHVIRLAEEARDDAVLDWAPADLESSLAECHLAAEAVNEALWTAQCDVANRRGLGDEHRAALAEAAAGIVDWLVSEYPATTSDLEL